MKDCEPEVGKTYEIEVGDTIELLHQVYNCGSADGYVYALLREGDNVLGKVLSASPRTYCKAGDKKCYAEAKYTYTMPNKEVTIHYIARHAGPPDWEVKEDYDETITLVPKRKPATWKINQAKDADTGEALSGAKIYVDGVYIHHYTPHELKFCDDCKCDTYVDCGFGTHTVTVKKSGYQDWSKSRKLSPGDSFEDTPELTPTSTTPTPSPTTTPTPTPTEGTEEKWKSVSEPYWDGDVVKVDCVAQNLLADKRYYARGYCGDELVASCELQDGTASERSCTLIFTETAIKKWCSPLPFDIKVVLTENGTEKDKVTRTIPKKPIMTKQEFIDKIREIGQDRAINLDELPREGSIANKWFYFPTAPPPYISYYEYKDGKPYLGIEIYNIDKRNPPSDTSDIQFLKGAGETWESVETIDWDWAVARIKELPFVGIEAILEVTTVPDGVEVWVDGKDTGSKTPCSVRIPVDSEDFSKKVSVTLKRDFFRERTYHVRLYANKKRYLLAKMSGAVKVCGKTKKGDSEVTFKFVVGDRDHRCADIWDDASLRLKNVDLELLNLANGEVKRLNTGDEGIAEITIDYDDSFFVSGKQKLVCAVDGTANRIRSFKTITITKTVALIATSVRAGVAASYEGGALEEEEVEDWLPEYTEEEDAEDENIIERKIIDIYKKITG